MLGLNAGTAYVSIKPDLRGMHSSVATQLRTTDRQFATAGTTAGTTYQKSFGKRFLGGLGTIAKRGAMTLGTVGVIGAAAIAKSSIKLEQEFGSTMSQIGAATEAPKRQLKSLSDLALKMGADTVFSANEASGAMLELAKGGMKPATIQAGGLKGTLQLAAAGGTDMATAAMIASDALNVFGLRGKDMGAVAAALAGGANASSASVESLGLAMSQAGLSANDARMSVQDTVGVLAAFDNAGLKGSDAGTSLKTMLARLVPQTEAAEDAMEKYNLRFTDAHGNMRSITDVAEQLHTKLSGLSDAERKTAMARIFGSDATRAATVLMRQGEEGLAGYIRKTSDLGAAQRMADARMKGTSGAIERMKGSLETAGLAIGMALRPVTIAISNMVGEIAKKALPYIEKFGKWIRQRMRGGNIFEQISGWVTRMLPKLRQIAPDAKKAFAGIAPALGEARKELPSFTDLLSVSGIVLRFLADHADLVAKALPYLAAGFLLVKAAQVASNIAASISIPLRIAELNASRRLRASNLQLSGSLTGQAAASRGAAAAEATNTGAKNRGIAATVRSRVTTIAKSVAERASAAASKAMAAGQWLVNAAMSANPIGLVIIAIVALVAAFVLAWKKSETFRKIVIGVWEGIKRAVAAVWGGIKRAVSAGVNFVVDFVKKYWPVLLTILLGPLGLAISLIIKNWDKIKAAFSAAWDWVKRVFSKAWSGVKAILSQALENARNNLAFIWGKIEGAFTAVWDWVKSVFARSWRNIKTILTAPLDLARKGISAVWENGIKPIFTRLGDFVQDRVVPVFRRGVQAIGKVWDWLKSAATKPINFIIDTVYNNGIRKFVNGLLDRFGIDTRLPYVQPIGAKMSGGSSGQTAPGLTMATGGVVPGYTPGRDVALAAVSGGEAVMRPEWQRAVGRDQIEAWNAAARRGGVDAVRRMLASDYRGGYARGGIVRPVSAPWSGTWGRYASGGYHPALDFPVPSGTPVSSMLPGRVSSVQHLTTSYGNHVRVASAGAIEAIYAHLSETLARAGQQVDSGDLLGRSGNTGNTTGPHLHLELRRAGIPFDFTSMLTGAGMPAATGTGKSWTEKLVTKFADWASDKGKALIGAIPGGGGNVFTDVAKGMGNRAVDAIRNWIVERWGGGTGEAAIPKGPTVEIARRMAAQRGWTGAQWNALSELVSRESSWNPTAQNPTSSAYGLFQFLDSTWASVGGRKTSDPGQQLLYGLRYIAQRYGTPLSALGFHDAHNWYDEGGWLPHGGTARNASGKPEPVFTNAQWRVLRASISRQTLGGGTAVSAEWLADLLSRVPKDAGALRREFVRARDALRGFRERTLTTKRALDELTDTERYRQARFNLRGIEAKLEDQRSTRAVRTDIAKARRDLNRAQRGVHGRAGAEALGEYRQAARALEGARTTRELKQAERAQQRRKRLAERDLKRADTDAAKHRARVEVEAADKRLKAIEGEGNERERLQRRYERAAKAEPVAELAASRERLKRLRHERDRIRELRKARREAADAKPLQRYEKLQERLNKRVEDEKRARERAKRAAEAYKAAQEAAIERARGIYETGTALGGIEAAPSKTSGGILANLRRAVATVRDWRGIVGRLMGAGLRGPILDEFLAAGPSADAVRLGKSLLAGGQISEIVRLQEQLRRESVAAGARGARYYKPKPVAGARRASALPADAAAAAAAGRTYQIVYTGMPADTVDTIVHKTTQRVRYEIGREATL